MLITKPCSYISRTGSYNITLTVYNSCGLNLSTQIILTTNISNNNSQVNVNVYPNPSKGFVTVENTDLKNVTIVIKDITGRYLYNVTLIDKYNHLDLSNLSDGLYFISIICNNKQNTIPITILR